MAVTIDDVFIEEFENNLISLTQQKESLFRSAVRTVSASGEGYNWDRIGPVAVSEKTTRGGATPVVDTPFSRRKSIPKTYNVGDLVTTSETVQMLPDPKSAIANQFAMAHSRGYDSAIITAATGDSRDGDGNPVIMPTGQVIGDGTADMSLDIITQVSEIFLTNHFDASVPKLFAISPAQARQLLLTTEYNSYDYNALRPLMAGEIVPFMGFNFVVSTLLDAGAGADSSKCFAMTYDAVGLQINNAMKARVSEDASASYDWRVYAEATYGAVRIEDEKVVVVDLDNVTG